MNREFEDRLKKRDITRRLTVPYNPWQNDTAERKNRGVAGHVLGRGGEHRELPADSKVLKKMVIRAFKGRMCESRIAAVRTG